MTATYTPHRLSTMFKMSFNMDEWYLFIKNIFGAGKLEEQPARIIGSNADDSFYLGSIGTSDNRRIGLFHCNTSIPPQNRRRELRHIVKRIESTCNGLNAALVVSQSNSNWSLSFIYGIDNPAAEPRRSTFVFGNKNLSYRTAVDRFSFLLERGASFGNIKEAFSADSLSNEFFDRYREQYADFIQHITGKRLVRRGKKWEERILGEPDGRLMQAFGHDEMRARSYVKRMMAQITLLHFLQCKGWLCGNANFVQEMFESSGYKDDFLVSVLEPLFFGIINTRPEEREALFAERGWDKSLLDKWNGIPYLNIGIIEPDREERIKIKFPAGYFGRLLQFLDEYTFTVEENSPFDAEVGIDPEIFGRIFENLLEDNKEKGTFYTPKYIVRYMCQESLAAYLETETEINKETIHKFILSPEEALAYIPDNKREQLLLALENVRICDPAVGSGAFTMGMLNELLHCREAFDGNSCNRSGIRRSIVMNNICGVDIENGAVDTARLRLWLSIIADEEKPSPLPNLDYRIMQGNSLIESLMGEDLSRIIPIYDDNGKCRQESIPYLISVYNTCDSRKKKIELQQKISAATERLLQEQGYTPATMARMEGIDLARNNIFFLWHTWFSDVFNRKEKKGFDIIIGNPPYIGEKGHKEIFQPVKADLHLGKYYLGKMDYLYFFFHSAFNMLRKNGICTFITTNYFLTASGARKLRADIKERMCIGMLFNLGALRLFENAPGQHNIICSFIKDKKEMSCRITDVHKTGILTPGIFASVLSRTDKETVYADTAQGKLYDGKENYIRLQNEGAEGILSSLLNKIKESNSTLGSIAQVNTGIMGGCDSITGNNIKYAEESHISSNDIRKNDGVFVMDCNNSRDLARITPIEKYTFCKPFYKSSDIGSYCTSVATAKRLIFSSSDLPAEEQEAIRHALAPYRPILTRIREINNEKTDYWYLLRRGTAHSNIFTGAKIVCPQRSRNNIFGYNECEWHASADVYYITCPDKRYHIKYILALLNSRLYYVWLYHRGKRKGETLELYRKPLSEIPIKCAATDIQSSIVEIVDTIIALKKSNPCHDTSILERKIDAIVYRIYNLSDAEIKAVEQYRIPAKS